MSKYETTFVVDSLRKSDDTQNILTKMQNFIKNNGGEIGEVEDWGKKRLAYEINRKQYGNYYQIHFEGPSNLPGLLEREFRLEEGILRFLTITSDPRAALTKQAPAEPAQEAKVEPAKETQEAEQAKETTEAKVESEAPIESEAKVDENDSLKEEAAVAEVKEEANEEAKEEANEEVKETEESEAKE